MPVITIIAIVILNLVRYFLVPDVSWWIVTAPAWGAIPICIDLHLEANS